MATVRYRFLGKLRNDVPSLPSAKKQDKAGAGEKASGQPRNRKAGQGISGAGSAVEPIERVEQILLRVHAHLAVDVARIVAHGVFRVAELLRDDAPASPLRNQAHDVHFERTESERFAERIQRAVIAGDPLFDKGP